MDQWVRIEKTTAAMIKAHVEGNRFKTEARPTDDANWVEIPLSEDVIAALKFYDPNDLNNAIRTLFMPRGKA